MKTSTWYKVYLFFSDDMIPTIFPIEVVKETEKTITVYEPVNSKEMGTKRYRKDEHTFIRYFSSLEDAYKSVVDYINLESEKAKKVSERLRLLRIKLDKQGEESFMFNSESVNDDPWKEIING